MFYEFFLNSVDYYLTLLDTNFRQKVKYQNIKIKHALYDELNYANRICTFF